MGLFHKTVDQKNKKYEIVPDWNDLSRQISAFRDSYNDFFRDRVISENGEIQKHVTQPYWHVLHLQKKRMAKLGITMEMKCDRRNYTHHLRGCGPLRENNYADGKYDAADLFEELTATITFYRSGQKLGEFEYDETANYVMLSAKKVGGDKVLCVNCGAEATRENLIDGCDYCGTKYTVEDLDGRIGHFAFNDDYFVKMCKYGASAADKGGVNKYEITKYHYDKYAAEIREKDAYFSLFELFANIRNKLATLYFAEDSSEINAFSEIDLRYMLEENKDVFYLQLIDVHVKDYEIRGTFQYVNVFCALDVFELKGNKIEKNLKAFMMKLMKVERNKTKAANAPTVMKCRGCGNSVTLLDGKTCPICGRTIDLIQYDWVIVEMN